MTQITLTEETIKNYFESLKALEIWNYENGEGFEVELEQGNIALTVRGRVFTYWVDEYKWECYRDVYYDEPRIEIEEIFAFDEENNEYEVVNVKDLEVA